MIQLSNFVHSELGLCSSSVAVSKKEPGPTSAKSVNKYNTIDLPIQHGEVLYHEIPQSKGQKHRLSLKLKQIKQKHDNPQFYHFYITLKQGLLPTYTESYTEQT